MATPHMTASDQGPTEQVRARPADLYSPPMANQNSGGHGYEMYPQQFVRLVGCHDAPTSALRRYQDEKLH